MVFWNKYSIVNNIFSPRQFWVDFGYVVLQKFLLLLIPNLLLYQFFPGPTLQQLDYSDSMKLSSPRPSVNKSGAPNFFIQHDKAEDSKKNYNFSNGQEINHKA